LHFVLQRLRGGADPVRVRSTVSLSRAQSERSKAMAFSDKESELVDELQVFANGLAANIGLYQVSQPDADTCVAAGASLIRPRP
jgi:hypothetical protein